MYAKSRRTLERALENGRMSERDVAVIRDFLADLQITGNVSAARIQQYVGSFYRAAKFLPSLVDASAADLYEAIAALKGPTAMDGERPYSASTLEMTITALKAYYRWAIESGYSQIPIQRINRIRPPRRDGQTVTAGDMLTPEEVQRIADACRRPVDRAIFWTLYEGGIRVGALTALRWRQVKFDRFGVALNIDDKTDKPRYVRLVMAAKPLATWRSDYPGDPTGDAPVFLSRYGRPFTRAGIAHLLRRTAKYAGIEKRIFPHLLRHTRVTHLIREDVNESVIKMMMWGHLDTPMLSRYTHLTGVDIDAEMLRTYGITDGADEQTRRLEPIQCPICHAISPPGKQYCADCGRALTPEAVSALDEAIAEARAAPEFQRLLDLLREG